MKGFRPLSKALTRYTGVLTAAYYGIIADRLGRRVALQLICLGELLALCWIIMVGM